MINFYRKIRKKLANDNKPLKYMRYAVGEIVLVIIGILIALQINNWNEIEKSKSESNRLLIVLKLDLEKDIQNFKSLQTEYNDWLLQIKNILDTVLDGNTKKITRYDQLMAGRLSMNYLSVNKIAFLDMFNSGRKLEFDNQEIVRDIKDYFQYADNQLIKLNSDNEEFYRLLMSYYGIRGINTLNRVIEKRNLEYIDWSWLTNPRSIEYINLETVMLLYQLVVEVNLSVIQELEKKSNLLIDKIEKELEGK
ncbi:DUF6090 family protein [Eudoraea sp.]|uniref:DUF6090 family protein n=1 Tax=Eudoraea sp. TaxID=1979955 RepID=UPI003C75B9D4